MSDYTFSPENIARISMLASDLRHKHDAMEWGVPPTQLIELEGLNYHEYDLQDEGILKRITKGAITIAKKIKAALCVKEKTVLIDDTLHHAKKPFGQSHELGHYCIPQHKQIFYFCSEHDLSPSMRKEMEFEANTFASALLFPDHLMQNIYKEYELSMQTIFYMKEMSGASIHSTAIKYVSCHPRLCCFVCLSKIESDENVLLNLKIKSRICSPLWMRRYGQLIEVGQNVPISHNLARVITEGGGIEGFMRTTVKIRNTELEFKAHSFYNSYEVFALLFIEEE